MKSELAIKRDEWFASVEGIKCLETEGLGLHPRQEKYLRNRLERAFLAGAIADDKVQREFCDKIADEIGMPRT